MDKVETLRKSMVPGKKLIGIQFICMATFYTLIIFVSTGFRFHRFILFLVPILIISLSLGSSLNWFIHFRRFKKALKNISQISFEPDGIVLKKDSIISKAGNFLRQYESKSGKIEKCYCFANISEDKECLLINVKGSRYAIVI